MAALIYSIKGEKSACSRLHLRNDVCAAGSIICYRGFQTAILVATVPRSFNQLLDSGALSRQRSNGLCESEQLNALVRGCDSTNIPPARLHEKGRNPGFRPCRNGCGGLQCTETAILAVPFRYSLAAALAACNVRFPRLSGRNWRRGTNARSRPAERAENKRSLIELP